MASPSQYVKGTALLLAVVVLWVTASFVMNSLFTDMDYNKPYLVTYLCTSTFSLYLFRPAYRIFTGKQRAPWHSSIAHGKRKATDGENGDDLLSVPPPELLYRGRSRSTSTGGRTASLTRAPQRGDPPMTTAQTAAVAFVFCGIWFVANWSMNAALGYTSVSSTTILSSMSGLFTLLLGSLIGVERFTPSKIVAVIVSIVGVVLVTKADRSVSSPTLSSDSRIPSAPLLGDALALASAVAYALYVILLKMRIGDESRVSMTLFFGFVGVFNIVFLWPGILLLNFAGVEHWQWPHGRDVWLGLGINAAITFVSDVLYLKAMLMTSPLAVTLGISLTIPLAMVGDLYRGTDLGGWRAIVGGLMVLMSFVANGLLDLSSAAEESDGVEDEEERARRALRRLSEHEDRRPLLRDDSR